MRLIHGQESVTAGTPAQLTGEPLRAVKLWVKYADGASGVARLSGKASERVWRGDRRRPRRVRLHRGGQGQHRRLDPLCRRIERHADGHVDADGGVR